jgi:flagellar biogenesis protein FliO
MPAGRSARARRAALAALAAVLLAVAPTTADEELPPADFGEFRVTGPSDEPRPAPAKAAETPRRRRSTKAAAADSRPARTPDRSSARATTAVAATAPAVAPARAAAAADTPATPEVKPAMPEVKPAVAPAPAPPVAMAPASPAAAPRPSSTESMTGVGGKLLLASLALAALLYGASRVVRRLPLGNLLPSADGPIRVVARTHLGPKTSLCLLEVAGTTVLVAMTPTGMQTLHVWAEGEAPSPAAALAAAAPRPAPATPGQLRGLETRITGKRG